MRFAGPQIDLALVDDPVATKAAAVLKNVEAAPKIQPVGQRNGGLRARTQRRKPHPQANVTGVSLGDRKSTRLNSSHTVISYAVFCLKKKKNTKARLGKHTEVEHVASEDVGSVNADAGPARQVRENLIENTIKNTIVDSRSEARVETN